MIDQAIAHLSKAVELRPGSSNFHRSLADLLASRQDFREAVLHYRRSLALSNPVVETLLRLGQCHKELRQTDEALAAYKHAYTLDRKCHLACQQIAQLNEQLNQIEDAQRYAELAIKLSPNDIESHFLLAKLDVRTNQHVNARKRLESLLDRDMSGHDRAIVMLELGRLLDRMGDYSTAFRIISDGNRLFEVNYRPHPDESDREQYRSEIDHYRDVFIPKWLPESGFIPDDPVRIIFLVGMPRSGTTLTEQILESHPLIHATHELPVLPRLTRRIGSLVGHAFQYPDDVPRLTGNEIHKLRKTYLAEMHQQIGFDPSKGQYLLDKLPLNILNIGLIYLMFPEARILVALRDPRDVCLSCFMQTFSLNQAMRQFLDINDTTRFYASTMNLWLHYRQHVPAFFLETRYEDIVDDLEGSARRMLNFIGAPWNSKVLKFHEHAANRAVHTPSYQRVTCPIDPSAIARWKSYEGETETAMEILAPFISTFDYLS